LFFRSSPHLQWGHFECRSQSELGKKHRTGQFQLQRRNYNPDCYREELRSRNKISDFPIT
jgi:hypothetical protein